MNFLALGRSMSLVTILLILLASQLQGAKWCDPNDPSAWDCNCPVSPIVIDLEGKGLWLTDAANGVLFDIAGNGIPIKMAWTAPGARNAWLALDRNGNGKIDNGKELFGNFTPQPESAEPNGFIALREIR